MGLTIWCNTEFGETARELLIEGTHEHRIIWVDTRSADVLQGWARDPQISGSDVLFGQPAVENCLDYQNVKWMEVTTSGYTRYDSPEFKEAFRDRG